MTTWGNSFLYSYIKLKSDADVNSLNEKITSLSKKHIPTSDDASFLFALQPIVDIHLYSNIQNEWQSNSDIRYAYILTIAAILILLVSGINYVNLWIARAEQRRHELHLPSCAPASHVAAPRAREAPPHPAVGARHDRHRHTPDKGIGQAFHRFWQPHDCRRPFPSPTPGAGPSWARSSHRMLRASPNRARPRILPPGTVNG